MSKRISGTNIQQYRSIRASAAEYAMNEADGDTAVGADRLLEMVEEYAESGEQWAQMLIRRWLHEGARRSYTAFVRMGRQQVYVPRKKKIVAIPSQYALGKRKPGGEREQGYQLHLWVHLPWESLLELLSAQRKLREHIQQSIDALLAALELREMAPDAATAFDACMQTGRDPATFQVASLAM